MSKNTAKMATYDEYVAIHRKNVEMGFNRGFTDEFLVELDPNGISIFAIAIPFHNDQNHHRCYAYMKMKESMDPYVGIIDIDVDQYEALADVPSYPQDAP